MAQDKETRDRVRELVKLVLATVPTEGEEETKPAEYPQRLVVTRRRLAPAHAVDDRGGGDLGGDLARGVAAHAVADHEDAGPLVGEEGVLVGLALATDVSAADGAQRERRDRGAALGALAHRVR